MKRLHLASNDGGKYTFFDENGDRYAATPIENTGLPCGVMSLNVHKTFGLSGAEYIGEVYIDGLGNVLEVQHG